MDLRSLIHSMEKVCDSIGEHVRVPSAVVLHRTKCCSLAKTYALGLQHAEELIKKVFSQLPSWADASQKLIPSLAELYHAMVQGERFIGKCLHRDEWVKRSLLLALSTDAVDICLSDFIWCICLIDQAVEQVLTSSRSGSLYEWLEKVLETLTSGRGGSLYELLETVLENEYDNIYTRLKTLWTDASEEEDLAILLKALNEKVSEYKFSISSSDVSEYRLAEFMLRNLSCRNFEDISADHEALPECLWVNADEVKIVESIGGGAFASVFKVQWWEAIFAQKEFYSLANEAIFVREAAIQARLRHSNLVQLIFCSAKPVQQKRCLVMELMDMSLFSLIEKQMDGRETPFSLVTAVDIMLQIAQGIEYLHRMGIMHRDVKSLNVLVSKPTPVDCLSDCRVSVKVADFGISKAKFQGANFTTLQAGTTRWRAPEVFEPEDEDDPQNEHSAKYTMKADVYSFAMVCYEILTGRLPFDDGGRCTKLRERVLRGERPQLPSSCPPYLASYIEQCWHVDPNKRPPFAQISRMLRHLKGVILFMSSADPQSLPSPLSGRWSSLIDEKILKIIGLDWPVCLSRKFTSRSMAILFEMPLYKIMMDSHFRPDRFNACIWKVCEMLLKQESRWYLSLLRSWLRRDRRDSLLRSGLRRDKKKIQE